MLFVHVYDKTGFLMTRLILFFVFVFYFFRMLTHTYVLGVYIGVIVVLAGKTCFIVSVCGGWGGGGT